MIDHVYISVTNIEKSLAFYRVGPEGVPDQYGLGDDAFGTREGDWLECRVTVTDPMQRRAGS